MGYNKPDSLYSWVNRLKTYQIYYSAPLDLDYLMLSHYTDFYKKEIPDGGGPRIPDKEDDPDKFDEKVNAAVKSNVEIRRSRGCIIQ